MSEHSTNGYSSSWYLFDRAPLTRLWPGLALGLLVFLLSPLFVPGSSLLWAMWIQFTGLCVEPAGSKTGDSYLGNRNDVVTIAKLVLGITAIGASMLNPLPTNGAYAHNENLLVFCKPINIRIYMEILILGAIL